MRFGVDQEKTELCSKKLTEKEIAMFQYAIGSNYWYQVFVDDLPTWGRVGECEGNSCAHPQLYTHRQFNIKYNEDRIISVNVTYSDEKVALPSLHDKAVDVKFTWGVKWTPTETKYEDRWDAYLDTSFFEHKIHWFSIFNSFMMVIFLTGLVGVILLRTLRRDYARYDKEEGLLDMDRDLGDEYGWKQVHGDVFRAPPNLTFISALLGTGVQLCVLTLSVIMVTIIGELYVERATMLTATVFLYALTAIIAGYYAGGFYTRNGGRNWVRCIFVTAGLWPGAVAVIALSVNFVAIHYASTRAIPFLTMLAILSIWLFLAFPLTLLGAIVGRNWSGDANFPCRINPIPRPIPDKAWYAEPLAIIALGGILPFGSIFIEMYFIFTSFWAYRLYYVYGFMLLVFIIMLIVTACVAIVATYFLLNSEDHRWHWVSFLASGSTAGYVFLYSIYYYAVVTKMYGALQTSWYFGYTGVACFGLFMMLGTVGHHAAQTFVRKIYANVKLD
ncbi:hypothetical protein HK097_000571 [Rhizophlyctis rosea]|uniref:Transmembrane 9 superfamily member n=1 Tax=Rhizophlyctis rosea TaxID=64517 RepID=A0AAD5XA57_9FUNG|nr:hypothetical protein HK097_000571 [Rhizophlyctis rosea]